jgi:hypothetical protein
MVEMVVRWARDFGGEVPRFTYRHVSPAYVGRRFVMEAKAGAVNRTGAGVEITVAIAMTDEELGSITTRGSVTVLVRDDTHATAVGATP